MDQYLIENMKWRFGNLGSIKKSDPQCLNKLESPGGASLNNYVGGSKTIGANDRFQKNGKIGWWNLVKSLKSPNPKRK